MSPARRVWRGLSAALLLFGAAACGESADDLAGLKAVCQRTASEVNCRCAAEKLNEDLSGDAKALMIAMLEAGKDGIPEPEVLDRLGLTAAEAARLMIDAMPAMRHAYEACRLK